MCRAGRAHSTSQRSADLRFRQVLLRQSTQCFVSYQVEVDSDVAEQGSSAGGIYFDEEEAGDAKSWDQEGGLTAAEHRGKLGGARGENESLCDIKEWVNWRCVRPRSIKYLAGERPPVAGTAVLATYCKSGQELYYDADVLEVRVLAGAQQVLVEYVHGEAVGKAEWLPLPSIYRLASDSVLSGVSGACLAGEYARVSAGNWLQPKSARVLDRCADADVPEAAQETKEGERGGGAHKGVGNERRGAPDERQKATGHGDDIVQQPGLQKQSAGGRQKRRANAKTSSAAIDGLSEGGVAWLSDGSRAVNPSLSVGGELLVQAQREAPCCDAMAPESDSTTLRNGGRMHGSTTASMPPALPEPARMARQEKGHGSQDGLSASCARAGTVREGEGLGSQEMASPYPDGTGEEEMDYAEVLRTWRTASWDKVCKFKKVLGTRFPLAVAGPSSSWSSTSTAGARAAASPHNESFSIASGINVLVDGSGLMRYRVGICPHTGLPDLRLLTQQEWTAAARCGALSVALQLAF